MPLNREAYLKLIREDIEWLRQRTPRALEREHILCVLEDELETQAIAEAAKERDGR